MTMMRLLTILSYITVVSVVPVMVNTPEDTVRFPHRTTPTHHWAPRRRQGQAVLATSQVIPPTPFLVLAFIHAVTYFTAGV